MRFSLLAVTALCASSVAAHADTYQLFNINGVLTNGATVTGTVNIDETNTNGPFHQANLTYTLGSTSMNLNVTNVGNAYSPGMPYTTELDFSNSPNTLEYQLVFPTPNEDSFAGYMGGLCTGATLTLCNGVQSAVDQSNGNGGGFNTLLFVSGSSTPAAVSTAATPEPSSLALLGTGIVGVIGAARRRFLR